MAPQTRQTPDGQRATPPVAAFETLAPIEPDPNALEAQFASLHAALQGDAPDLTALIDRWQAIDREAWSWLAWVRLRFAQDTRDPARKAERARSDELMGLLDELEATWKRALLADRWRETATEIVGATAISLWTADARASSSDNRKAAVEEKHLASEYTAMLAGASFEFDGEQHDLVTIGRACLDADRDRRHRAQTARWTWFDERRDQLDQLFHQLVKLRHQQARTLGLPDATALGYLKMKRIDYDRDDVDRFRAEVQRVVVPLTQRIRARQAKRMGLDQLMFWDEEVGDPQGPPPLLCGQDGLGEAGRSAFADLDPELSAFYETLLDQGYIDLGARPGKAGGGFCTWMANERMPYVFCAGNGTHADVRTLVHEAGHAFQSWSARDTLLNEQIFPTSESAEIHSMALEHLAWPRMHVFFGSEADRWKRDHLERGLCFLPYGTAVDDFQHRIYAQPEATPAERHAMWTAVEQIYLPMRDYGDLPHCSVGALWQRQRHIYRSPFYYIDYVLAQSCALQFWAMSLTDPAGTLETYKALCRLGGTLPFQELCKSAGLRSPFEPGCLDDVVSEAERWLDSCEV